MMYEEYHNKNNPHKRNHFGRKFLIFILFLAVLGVIFFTTIYEGGFTGNSIKEFNENNSVKISSETNIPSTTLTGEHSKITFDISSNKEMKLEGKKISLDKTSNLLVLEGFSGEVNFDENSINLLSGKVSKIYINGVPISNEKDVKMKISLDSDILYNSISFKNNFPVSEINFICSGKVNVGTDSINLNQDTCILKNALGEFLVKDKKLFFSGSVTSLDIKGENKKVSISK